MQWLRTASPEWATELHVHRLGGGSLRGRLQQRQFKMHKHKGFSPFCPPRAPHPFASPVCESVYVFACAVHSRIRMRITLRRHAPPQSPFALLMCGARTYMLVQCVRTCICIHDTVSGGGHDLACL